MENKDKKNQTVFIINNESSYLKANDIELYTVPSFNKVNGNYIPWKIGEFEWPDKLLELSNNSATHGRICYSIIQQVQGDGFIIDASLPNYLKTKEFLEKKNKDGESLFEVYCNVVEDAYNIGMYSILPDYSADKIKVDEVQYIPIRNLRAHEIDPSTFTIPGWWYSIDWSNENPGKLFFLSNDFKNTSNLRDQFINSTNMIIEDYESNLHKINNVLNTNNFQIIVESLNKKNHTSLYYKGLPLWIGAMNAILEDIEIDRFGLNTLENGLNVDTILSIIGNYTDEQKREFVESWNAQYRNKNRGLQTVIQFITDPTFKPQLDNFSTKSPDKIYDSINEKVLQKVLTAHGVTDPQLVGIQTPGLMGNADLKQAEDIFYKNIIKPIQNKIIKMFNDVLEYNGLDKIEVKRLYIAPENIDNKDGNN